MSFVCTFLLFSILQFRSKTVPTRILNLDQVVKLGLFIEAKLTIFWISNKILLGINFLEIFLFIVNTFIKVIDVDSSTPTSKLTNHHNFIRVLLNPPHRALWTVQSPIFYDNDRFFFVKDIYIDILIVLEILDEV